jgi:TatD DNase family protein
LEPIEWNSFDTPRLAKLPKRGLVHSFTGTMDEMNRMIALGLDVGE